MKRIVINIFLAIIIFPTTFFIRDYIQLDIMDDHSAYSGTFGEYIKLSAPTYIGIGSTLFLFIVLLPYNIIILRIKSLSFIKKILLFELIMVIDLCLIGMFSNVWAIPYWKNAYYLISFFFFGLLFSGIIHLFVDKKAISSSE